MSANYPCGFVKPYHSKKPICGVLAVALAADVSFDVATAACKASMHKLYPKRKRFGGKTWPAQIEHAMKGFGVKLTYKCFLDHINMRQALEQGYIDMEGHFIINVPGHFFTLKNGFVIDQSRNDVLDESHKFMRRQVEGIFTIKGKSWP